MGIFFACLVGNLIRKYINQPGIVNIVCAYDEYQNSPLAKGPTQNRRKSRGPIAEFAAHQPLPPTINANHNNLLFNRSYKRYTEIPKFNKMFTLRGHH